MNCYITKVQRHPKKSRGWLVILEFTHDVPPFTGFMAGAKKGDKFARVYHHHKDADMCENEARKDLAQAPQFYPYDKVAQ